MQSSRKSFQELFVIGTLVWMVAFVMIGWTFRETRHTSSGLWLPDNGDQIVKGRAVPILTGASVGDEERGPLRLALRATHVDRFGGEVTCGPASLYVPPSATERGGFFTLENMSERGLSFQVTHTASDLAIAPILTISYKGTQYANGTLDPSKLEIMREITMGVYQHLPTRVDRDAQCLTAECVTPGRYVVG